MDKREWIKTIGLIIFGMCIDQLVKPNSQVQSLLFSFFSIKLWGIGMEIITLIFLLLAILLYLIGTFGFNWGNKRRSKLNDTKISNDEKIEKIKRIINE
jgi:uncharacterized membrane protein YidH (DUF202 family)